MRQLKIMVVDDDPWIRDELDEYLSGAGFTAIKAALPRTALKMAEDHGPDIVILDIKLPEMDGLQVLEKLKTVLPGAEIIMITGHGDMESVIRAMRLGATDYLTKPFRLAEVRAAIERTRKFVRLNKKLKAAELNYTLLSRQFNEALGHPLVGKSPEMQHVIDLVSRVAGSHDTSVLITGESGTGKELIARAIHSLSSRKDGMFQPVNASAVMDSLFESEFFGHRKGSFTGADEDRIGWFEAADNGTLFLDEISNLPMGCQAKLLRALEEKKITRVGSQKEIPVDVRIIAASNQDVARMAEENAFRKDLYYRLNAFSISIAPLRRRKDDIPLLLDHFTSYFAARMNKTIRAVDPQATAGMAAYHFPGNVRELKNMVERAVILCDGQTLTLRHFPMLGAPFSNPLAGDPDGATDLEVVLRTMEKNLILRALDKTGNNKSRAARSLNISRQSLHRRMKKLDINPDHGGNPE